eukprot:9541800-Lingulodinium_polyedra.AAC.1
MKGPRPPARPQPMASGLVMFRGERFVAADNFRGQGRGPFIFGLQYQKQPKSLGYVTSGLKEHSDASR